MTELYGIVVRELRLSRCSGGVAPVMVLLLLSALTTAAGLGQLNTNYPKKILAGDLTPDFPIFMAIKDLDMAVELAKTFDIDARFGELARQAFVDACQDGMGHLDQTAIMQHFCMKK